MDSEQMDILTELFLQVTNMIAAWGMVLWRREIVRNQLEIISWNRGR